MSYDLLGAYKFIFMCYILIGRHYILMAKRTGSGIRLPGCACWLFCLRALNVSADRLTSNPQFLICQMGVLTVPAP